MPKYDFRSPRLYVTGALKAGAELALDKSQAHYLRNVLRLKPGDGVLAFNGKDGEWQAALGRRQATGPGAAEADPAADRAAGPALPVCSAQA